jgi:hemolysin-activating ACP:hemolysin acyltransferase
MTYSITYQKGNEVHHLEWIAPTGWSTNAVCESFARQFPQAELIDIQQRTGQ